MEILEQEYERLAAVHGAADHGVAGYIGLYGIESPGLTSSMAIAEYVAETRSEWGEYILENFNHFQRKIWMVKPKAAEFDSLLASLQSNAA